MGKPIEDTTSELSHKVFESDSYLILLMSRMSIPKEKGNHILSLVSLDLKLLRKLININFFRSNSKIVKKGQTIGSFLPSQYVLIDPILYDIHKFESEFFPIDDTIDSTQDPYVLDQLVRNKKSNDVFGSRFNEIHKFMK